MPEIILHFDAGTDAQAVAKLLQAQAATLAGVTSAEAEAYPKRGAPEIILALTVAATVLNQGTTSLESLKKFIDAAKAVGVSLGLANLRLEIGTKQVAPAALTDADVIDIERGG